MIFAMVSDGVIETFDAPDPAAAREVAQEWLRTGGWNEIETTIWLVCSLTWTDADGDGAEERVRVAIDPSEPRCTGVSRDGHRAPATRRHDWQSPYDLVGGLKENPGIWGHGGGILIVEACVRCGCKRTTDTWAQDRETGEQGLRSVNYEVDVFDVAKDEVDA